MLEPGSCCRMRRGHETNDVAPFGGPRNRLGRKRELWRQHARASNRVPSEACGTGECEYSRIPALHIVGGSDAPVCVKYDPGLMVEEEYAGLEVFGEAFMCYGCHCPRTVDRIT